MGLGHYLFSFSGRINRAKQWAGLLVGLVFAILMGVLFGSTIGSSVIALMQGKTTVDAIRAMPQFQTFELAACALYLLGFYIGLAIATKRLHDRNKSAWWLLIFFALPIVLNLPALALIPERMAHMGEIMKAAREHVPPPQLRPEPPLVALARLAGTLISLWAFVELYFFRGTAGENRFGPDPLAGRD
jgi:uncharacterized membrane protein YhaH (DUF805 family)